MIHLEWRPYTAADGTAPSPNLPPLYHNVAGHASPFDPLWPKMTSIKLEVHNISQRR